MVRADPGSLTRWLLSKEKRGCQGETLRRYRGIVRSCLCEMRHQRRSEVPSRWRERDFDHLRLHGARSRWAFGILVDYARFAGSRITPLLSFPPRPFSHRVRWLDRTSMEGLIRAVRRDPVLSLIVVLGLGQGLRRVEWRRLRVSDVDLESGRILVRGKGRTVPKLVWMPLHPALPPIWKRFLARRAQVVTRNQLHGAGSPPPPEAFIHQWRGKLVPYSLSGLDAWVERLGTRLGNGGGTTRLSSHMLRRSGATLLEEVLLGSPHPSIDGVYRAIQSFLRHENIATTMRYLQENPARQRRALEQFGSALPWA